MAEQFDEKSIARSALLVATGMSLVVGGMLWGANLQAASQETICVNVETGEEVDPIYCEMQGSISIDVTPPAGSEPSDAPVHL